MTKVCNQNNHENSKKRKENEIRYSDLFMYGCFFYY